jgi:integrase
MGTIVARDRKNGTKAYMAKIILKREGKVVHRESETFDRRPAALAWMVKREAELSKPGALERANRPRATLADAIDKYTQANQDMGRTKEQVLRTIRSLPIAAKDCASITSADLVAFADELRETRQPQTVANYMSHLQAVFAIAEDAWGYQLDMAQMSKAMRSSRRLGTVAKSTRRDRRPTLDEMNRLMTHFQEVHRRRPASMPMHVVAAFALFSTRRQEEITRILWSDYQGDRVLVRDMKHPGQKIGNNVWVDLPEPARRIVDARPRSRPEIFPYTTDAISAAFTRACQFLAIDDLVFHDLRHEGISRLFETGLGIPQVAMVSGHRSWSSLQRYTHIRQVGDKYAGWEWLEVVT